MTSFFIGWDFDNVTLHLKHLHAASVNWNTYMFCAQLCVSRAQLRSPRNLVTNPGSLTRWHPGTLHTDGQPSYRLHHWSYFCELNHRYKIVRWQQSTPEIVEKFSSALIEYRHPFKPVSGEIKLGHDRKRTSPQTSLRVCAWRNDWAKQSRFLGFETP